MGKIFRKLKTGETVILNLSHIRSKFRIGGIEGTPGKEKRNRQRERIKQGRVSALGSKGRNNAGEGAGRAGTSGQPPYPGARRQ